MKLKLQALPPETRGIYRVNGVVGRLPPSALYLAPDVAEAFALLTEATRGHLVFSGIWRSAEQSLQAIQEKAGVQPPGYSGHNYGLSFDLALDNFRPPGSPKQSRYERGSLARLGWLYSELVECLAEHHFYCHRADGKRGFEDWHFNFLPYEAHGASSIEAEIQLRHASDFQLDDRAAQKALQKIGLYLGALDGIWGPRSQTAFEAFGRAWKCPSGNVAIAMRTLAFVAADIERIQR